MKRRSFLLGASAGLLAARASGAAGPPDPIDIPDREGESTLLPAVGAGPRPLIYMSHRLGGVPAKGRQNEAPWILFGALQNSGWNILRSADAGPETYGNDNALDYCARMFAKTIDQIDWDGRLFSLGISMGALPAQLMTWNDRFDHPVRAISTIAGVADLSAVHASPAERRERIDAAYGVTENLSFKEASRGHDPLNDFRNFRRNEIPLLAVASRDDTLLPIDVHAEPMVRTSREAGGRSELVRISGDHIGPEHFTPKMAARIIAFFESNGP